MALQVFIAHTGDKLEADPVSFNHLDALRAWIAKATTIPAQDQILLTTRGKHVKLQALLTEKEIFLYDRELFAPHPGQPPSSLIPPISLPERFTPEDPPSTLANQNDLKAWQDLFKSRRDWTTHILDQCRSMSISAREYFGQQAMIERALRIATGNHDTHIRNLEQKYTEARAWFEDVAKEQETNRNTWERNYTQFSSVPAKREFFPFIVPRDSASQKTPKASKGRSLSLQDFLDADVIRTASSRTKAVTDSFSKRFGDMSIAIDKITTEYNDLQRAVEQGHSRSMLDDTEEPTKLLDEMDAVVKKVASDYEHVLGLPANPKSVAQVSKMALLHTRNYLPTLKEYSIEMSDLLRRSVEQKNAAVNHSIENMQNIASIESGLARINSELSSLDVPREDHEAFDSLAFVSRLPFVYGSLLIEAIRRRDWVDKIKKDTSALAEEMAGFQEEEEKRRKKWLKTVADAVNVELFQSSLLGLEITLRGEEHGFPGVTRAELQTYITTLAGIEGFTTTLKALNQAIEDLDRPTKLQVKRAKNFKMGSLNEAALGRGSLLLRGDDDTRVLREVNVKLEEELKGSRSRIRKLEDLLHRQSHISRLSIGSGYQTLASQGPQSPGPATPDPNAAEFTPAKPMGDHSRRSSISSRRFSSNQTPEDKTLARKLLNLEAELQTEKDIRAGLEKDARSRHQADMELDRQIREANSTKQDLMENMEAQQKEFAVERRAYEDELNRYKLRMEEVEDELERLLGSRDNERTGIDTKMQDLVAELDQIRKEAAEEVHRTHEEVHRLEETLQQRDSADTERRIRLASTHSQLSPGDSIPTHDDDLVAALETLAQRSISQIRELEETVNIVRSENDLLRSKNEQHEAALRLELESQGQELHKVKEELEEEKARGASTAAELTDERQHLQSLRAKFAEGETGSEALRQRITEEEAKVGNLSSEVAASKAHANNLQSEFSSLQRKYSQLQAGSEQSSERLRQRSDRVKELSNRLFTQTSRLYRMVEACGLAVTYQDDNMVIQRPSKSSSSAILQDPGASLTRSTPITQSIRKTLEESSDLSMLLWMEKEDVQEENDKYTEYITTLNRFNLDTFSDAIPKRIKDIEHTARKWQRDARAYREKAHRAQHEAHEKIAFRSFKEGDLALFLPTRNQATRPWAAFNVGAPHYFLREQDSHKLHHKEWLVARISKVEERVVDLSKAMDTVRSDGRSIGEISEGGMSYEDENPFELSDGLRWWLLDAAEEKSGAPSTPGLGKTTVASAHVDARGSVRAPKKSSTGNDVSKTLNKSLESRRSSGNSRKSVPVAAGVITNKPGQSSGTATTGEDNSPAVTSPPGAAGPSGLRIDAAAAAAAVEETVKTRNIAPQPSIAPSRSAHSSPRKNSVGNRRLSTSASPRKNTLVGARRPSVSTSSPRKHSINDDEGDSIRRLADTSPSRDASPSGSRPSSSKPQGSGLWNSLWQFEFTYESGKRK